MLRAISPNDERIPIKALGHQRADAAFSIFTLIDGVAL